MKKTRTQRKPKYDRRRALDCKLIEKSKKNAGYFKYEVTIGEKDGTVHKEPAYNHDVDLPQTMKFHNQGLWLPFFAEITREEQDYVIEVLKRLLDELR